MAAVEDPSRASVLTESVDMLALQVTVHAHTYRTASSRRLATALRRASGGTKMRLMPSSAGRTSLLHRISSSSVAFLFCAIPLVLVLVFETVLVAVLALALVIVLVALAVIGGVMAASVVSCDDFGAFC